MVASIAVQLRNLMLVFAWISSFVAAQYPTSYAQLQNPFQIPASGFSMKAGEPVTINWIPTTSGTITLVLRSGSGTGLQEGLPIAEKIPNNGTYAWTPPKDITRGNDYTLEIINDALPNQTNYSPYFVIDSDNLVASATSTFTYGAPPTDTSASEQHLTPTSTVSPTGTLPVSKATPTTTVTSGGGDNTGAAIASGFSMTSHSGGKSSSIAMGTAAAASTSKAGAAMRGLKNIVPLGAGVVVLLQ